MAEFLTTLDISDIPWPQAPATEERKVARPATARLPTAAVPGGRQSLDRENDYLRSGLQYAMQLSSEERWRDRQLDNQTLNRISLSRLTELICDLSPEVSRAVWDFLRFCNPGFEVKVFAPESDEQTEDAKGKEVIDAFIKLLKERHGSIDVVINRLFLGGMLRGSFACELVFDLDRMTPYELATPDPKSFRFRKIVDPVLKFRWQIGQFQGRDFVPLDIPTLKFVPIDPLPGKPTGRAPISAALFGAIFLLGLLHDIRRVIQQQGYPRLDITVDLAAITAILPQEVLSDPDKFKSHVDNITKQVIAAYAQLEPDDVFVHTSDSKIEKVGVADSESLGGIDKLITAVERLTIRGLKSIPLLQGVTDGVSEANANRQWETHAAGIKSIQHLVESMLESLCDLALQANGNQGKTKWRFAELRASEMLRDAQTESLQIRNEVAKYNQGWTTQDEGAIAITGHKADQQEPRNTIAAMAADSGIGNPGNTQPDPGANRFIQLLEQTARDQSLELKTRNAAALALLLTTATTEPPSREVDNAEQYWRDNAPDEAKDLIDAENVE